MDAFGSDLGVVLQSKKLPSGILQAIRAMGLGTIASDIEWLNLESEIDFTVLCIGGCIGTRTGQLPCFHLLIVQTANQLGAACCQTLARARFLLC